MEDRAFFETLVEKGSDAIITIDEGSTIRFANESVQRILGYDPDALVGESLTAVMPERFHTRHQSSVDQYIETGERGLDWNNIRLPGEHREGHEVPLSITFEEHRYDGERLFSGIIRDASEQSAYEQRLTALQETAQRLLRARDTDEICETAVDAAENVLGFELGLLYRPDPAGEQLRPAAWTTLADTVIGPPPVLPADGGPAWEAFETGETGEYEGMPAGDGVFEPTASVGGLLAIPVGDAGVLLFGSTDEPTFDDEIVKLAHLLAANTEAALNRADREAELQRQNEQLERFASVLSHDLRDPLNAANAQVALALEAEDDEAYLRELEALHARMGDIIEDVLAVARHDSAVGETDAVDLWAVAEDAWDVTASGEATLEVADGLGTVQADRTRLRRLLENLFGNAVGHAGSGVTVRVGALADEPGFYVEDDGPGIPADEREQVLEYGYTTAADGTGQGLNIVANISEAHGWQLRITDGTDGGARFEFAFAAPPTRTAEGR